TNQSPFGGAFPTELLRLRWVLVSGAVVVSLFLGLLAVLAFGLSYSRPESGVALSGWILVPLTFPSIAPMISVGILPTSFGLAETILRFSPESEAGSLRH
ncbi:MAG: hypothetical protein WCH99_18365, partial [Verrucomicrobiota bacterium]